jgi:hypothetical protein
MYIHSSYVLLFKKKARTRNRKKVRTKFVGMKIPFEVVRPVMPALTAARLAAALESPADVQCWDEDEAPFFVGVS